LKNRGPIEAIEQGKQWLYSQIRISTVEKSWPH